MTCRQFNNNKFTVIVPTWTTSELKLMNMYTEVLALLFLFVALLFQLVKHQRTKPKLKNHLLPGPPSLPIIGNLHQVGKLIHQSLFDLYKIYGPIFQLRIGEVPTLVISSPYYAQQVLKTHDLAFCSRAQLVTFKEYSYNGHDVAAAPYGDHWRNLRKIFIIELLNSKKIESFRTIREEETENMIQSIKDNRSDKLVNISELMIRLTNNIISRISFGFKDEGKYGERSRFQDIFHEAHALMGSLFLGDCFSRLGWIDHLTGKIRRLKRNKKDLDDFYETIIKHHLENVKTEHSKEDIIDVFLRLRREGENITMDDIKASLSDIIVGGTDTSAITVIWAMTELIRNPKVMRKAQESVRNAIGNKGKVEEKDLSQIQYLKSVINETFRMHPPLPLLMPRETIEECKIDDYYIAPKTRVFVNVWAMGKDEKNWENPMEFNPDRFNGSSIDHKGQNYELLPFGGGRRICPGVQLGDGTVQLALASLLYHFEWDLAPGTNKEDIDMQEAEGFLTHKKIDLRLVARIY